MDAKLFFLGVLMMGVFVLIPVLAIMTEHQRKMAKILNNRSSELPPTPEVSELLAEVRSLRAEVASLSAREESRQRMAAEHELSRI